MIRRRSEALLTYACFAVAALLWRGLSFPWDLGGLSTQTMFGVVFAWMALAMTYFRELDKFSLGLINVLLVIISVLGFMWAYFDVLAILPFLVVCLVLVLVWGRSKTVKAKLMNTLVLALPLAAVIIYGLNFAIPIYHLRNLKIETVREIDLVRTVPGPAATTVKLTKESEIEPILLALRKTSPYGPHGDSFDPPWQMIVELNSGERLVIRVGKGTRFNANTCHVLVDISSYQNEPLCQLLKTLNPQF